jgi:hypothetical protein
MKKNIMLGEAQTSEGKSHGGGSTKKGRKISWWGSTKSEGKSHGGEAQKVKENLMVGKYKKVKENLMVGEAQKSEGKFHGEGSIQK